MCAWARQLHYKSLAPLVRSSGHLDCAHWNKSNRHREEEQTQNKTTSENKRSSTFFPDVIDITTEILKQEKKKDYSSFFSSIQTRWINAKLLDSTRATSSLVRKGPFPSKFAMSNITHTCPPSHSSVLRVVHSYIRFFFLYNNFPVKIPYN